MSADLTPGLVSIVVPVHNAEQFLAISIGSVFRQSYSDWEMLLVNDGSTDRSEEICNYYAHRDARIRVLSQQNGGPAAARNLGVRQATGEFLLFLDADDLIESDALRLLTEAYRQHQPDLVICNFSKKVSTTETVKQRVALTPENVTFEGASCELSQGDLAAFVRHFLKHPSNHLISYCWARMYRLSVIREFGISAPEDMRLFEDFVFNLEYLKHTRRTIFLNQALYVYVMHNSHISASMTIVDAASLLHDKEIFRERAADFLNERCAGMLSPRQVEQEIGHALIHYLIIFLVRTCRQITDANRDAIRREIERLVNAPLVRESISHYTPAKGNSRMLPLLMKLRFVGLLMSISRYKAIKRYGKL